MLRCGTLGFLVQLNITLPSLSSPLNLILPQLLLSDFLVFLSHWNYILVQVSSLYKNSINPVHFLGFLLLLDCRTCLHFPLLVPFLTPPPPLLPFISYPLLIKWYFFFISPYSLYPSILYIPLLQSWFLCVKMNTTKNFKKIWIWSHVSGCHGEVVTKN